MVRIIVIISIILLLLVCLCIILITTKVCAGGDLFAKECGKLLFPWSKRFKLPSGKFCCMDCYMNELQKFSEMRSEPDGLTFVDENVDLDE